MNFQKTYDRIQEVVKGSQKPSITQPGMSMTIREIQERYATGRPVPINKNLVYGGHQWYPDLDTLDLVEREKYLNEAIERVELLTEKMQSETDAYKLAVQQREFDKWKEIEQKFKASAAATPGEGLTPGGTTTE